MIILTEPRQTHVCLEWWKACHGGSLLLSARIPGNTGNLLTVWVCWCCHYRGFRPAQFQRIAPHARGDKFLTHAGFLGLWALPVQPQARKRHLPDKTSESSQPLFPGLKAVIQPTCRTPLHMVSGVHIRIKKQIMYLSIFWGALKPVWNNHVYHNICCLTWPFWFIIQGRRVFNFNDNCLALCPKLLQAKIERCVFWKNFQRKANHDLEPTFAKVPWLRVRSRAHGWKCRLWVRSSPDQNMFSQRVLASGKAVKTEFW